MLDPREVANAAVFFLSDESRAVTGQVLKVDGGWSVVSVGPRRGVTFVRTVLGDIDPGELGVTYAHEHLVIDGGRPVELSPDFLLADVDADGDRADRGRRRRAPDRVDAMPCDCGRNAGEARRAVAADRRPDRRRRPASTTSGSTGRRTGAPRATRTSSPTCSSPTSTDGIDERDYGGPIVRRTDAPRRRRQDRRQRRWPVGARPADLRGGRGDPPPDGRPDPHPLRGRHRRAGAAPRADRRRRRRRRTSSLSHVDKVVDRGYHRELAGDRRVRRIRPVVPLGRRDNGTLKLHRVGRRGRLARPDRCSGWTRPARATTASTVARPA